MRYLSWLWRKVACITIGHNIDPCDDYAVQCFRCGLTFHYDRPPRNDVGFWLNWLEFKKTIREFLKPAPRRCEVCGEKARLVNGFICGKAKCADDWMPF